MYQMDLLSDEQNIIVEAHLLECEACFKEVYRLRPVFELLEEMPERFLDDLQPKKTLVRKTIERLKNLFAPILSTSERWWQKPAIKILAPATVVIVLAMIFLLPFLFKPTEYSDLVILKKPSYPTLQIKGDIELTPTQKLFEEGIKFYEQDKYTQAIQKLTVYIEQETDNPHGHFYLGSCFVLMKKFEKGIEHLKLASDLSQEQGNQLLLEKCYWYLGNAYLKTNDVENALSNFRQILEMQGEFATDVQQQIIKIDAIKKKKEKE